MTRSAVRFLCLFSLGSAAVGCAAPAAFVYRPSAALLADGDGQPAAIYPLPPERPEGEMRVLSFGFIDLQPGPGAVATRTLHIRLQLANNGDPTPFSLDTRGVQLDVPGASGLSPSYANTDVGPREILTVNAGERRIIDFYFSLPAHLAAAQQLSAFDLRWQVATRTRVVSERTAFTRVAVAAPPPPPPVVIVAGWGPFWWFAPHFPHVHLHAHQSLHVRPHRHWTRRR